jgi:hypothetical protein
VRDEGDCSELIASDLIVFLSELAFTDSQRITACKWEFYMQINLAALCTFIDRYSPFYFSWPLSVECAADIVRVY